MVLTSFGSPYQALVVGAEQKAFKPPMPFSNVALFLDPCAFALHLPDL